MKKNESKNEKILQVNTTQSIDEISQVVAEEMIKLYENDMGTVLSNMNSQLKDLNDKIYDDETSSEAESSNAENVSSSSSGTELYSDAESLTKSTVSSTNEKLHFDAVPKDEAVEELIQQELTAFFKGKKVAKDKKTYDKYKLTIKATKEISVENIFTYLQSISIKPESIIKQENSISIKGFAVVSLYNKYLKKINSLANDALPTQEEKEMHVAKPKSIRRKKQASENVEMTTKIKELVEKKVRDYFVEDNKLIKPIRNKSACYKDYEIIIESDDKKISSIDIMNCIKKNYLRKKGDNVVIKKNSVHIYGYAVVSLAKKIIPINLLPPYLQKKRKDNNKTTNNENKKISENDTTPSSKIIKQTTRSPSSRFFHARTSSSKLKDNDLTTTVTTETNSTKDKRKFDVLESSEGIENRTTSVQLTPKRHSHASFFQPLSLNKKDEEVEKKPVSKKFKLAEEISELKNLEEEIKKVQTEQEQNKHKIMKHILNYQEQVIALTTALSGYSQHDPLMGNLITEAQELTKKIDHDILPLDALEKIYTQLKAKETQLIKTLKDVKEFLKNKSNTLKKNNLTIILSDSEPESDEEVPTFKV